MLLLLLQGLETVLIGYSMMEVERLEQELWSASGEPASVITSLLFFCVYFFQTYLSRLKSNAPTILIAIPTKSIPQYHLLIAGSTFLRCPFAQYRPTFSSGAQSDIDANDVDVLRAWWYAWHLRRRRSEEGTQFERTCQDGGGCFFAWSCVAKKSKRRRLLSMCGLRYFCQKFLSSCSHSLIMR